jgi:hypothetical protein
MVRLAARFTGSWALDTTEDEPASESSPVLVDGSLLLKPARHRPGARVERHCPT